MTGLRRGHHKMLDTNAIAQVANNVAAASQAAGAAATTIKATMSPWMPALAVAGAFAGREWNRFCQSAKGGTEWLLSHGGILPLIGKLIWNSKGRTVQPNEQNQRQNL